MGKWFIDYWLRHLVFHKPPDLSPGILFVELFIRRLDLGFITLGLVVWALIGYAVFGASGGLLDGLTLNALRRAGFFAYLVEKR